MIQMYQICLLSLFMCVYIYIHTYVCMYTYTPHIELPHVDTRGPYGGHLIFSFAKTSSVAQQRHSAGCAGGRFRGGFLSSAHVGSLRVGATIYGYFDLHRC